MTHHPLDNPNNRTIVDSVIIWIFQNPSEFFIGIFIICVPLLMLSVWASYQLSKAIEKREKRLNALYQSKAVKNDGSVKLPRSAHRTRSKKE